MDVQMPVVGGIEATTKIRAREEEEGLKPIPIIALTAYTKGTEKDDMFTAGGTNYITKPIDVSELLELLGRTLQIERPHENPSNSAGADSGASEAGSGASEAAIASPESEEERDYIERLLKEFGDTRDTLAEMLDMSLKELPQRIEAIEEGMSPESSATAAENCHALANVASILKAELLRDEAITMERLLKNNHLDYAKAQFEIVTRLTDSLIRSFRNILEEDL